jgi:hypothetical protein
MSTQYTKADAAKAIPTLRRFMSEAQISALGDACYGEERHYFINKIVELAEHLNTMPKTYEQDGKGDDAVVYLHYFRGGMDWYITEKDMEAEQHQAFGLADLGMGFPELGYINISELVDNNVELDLYWEPKTLREVKEGRS